MCFCYIGTPKNISALKTASLKYKQIERKSIKIAIIDNEDFPIMSILERHKFDIDVFNDITNGKFI